MKFRRQRNMKTKKEIVNFPSHKDKHDDKDTIDDTITNKKH